MGKRSDGNESLSHEYWKRQYAVRYAAQGYQVEIEAPRDPNDGRQGRVDVLATKSSGRASESVRCAIEIETGKSDVVANVKRNLLAGFDKVLVVPTNQKGAQPAYR